MDVSPALLSSLQKLRLFNDLSPTQLKRVFTVCRQDQHEPESVLCRAGGESDRMYIVIAGEVEIVSPRGTPLARESAVTTIGETGLLSGEPRAATVRVVTPVTVLVIKKRPLMQLMQEDAALTIRLYRNAMVLVRQKLIDADEQLERVVRAGSEAAD